MPGSSLPEEIKFSAHGLSTYSSNSPNDPAAGEVRLWVCVFACMRVCVGQMVVRGIIWALLRVPVVYVSSFFQAEACAGSQKECSNIFLEYGWFFRGCSSFVSITLTLQDFCFSIPRHTGDAVTNIRLWVLIIDYKAVYEALKQACIIKQKYFSVLDVALFKCSTFKDFKF